MEYAFLQNATPTWRRKAWKIACSRSRAIYYVMHRIVIAANVPFLLGAVNFQLTGSYAIYITFTANAGAHYGNECREGHGGRS